MFLTPGLCQSDRTEAGQSSQVSGLVTKAIIGVINHHLISPINSCNSCNKFLQILQYYIVVIVLNYSPMRISRVDLFNCTVL